MERVVIMGDPQLLYHNNRYHVFVRKYPAGEHSPAPYPLIHLSIKNNDKSPRHDWRDFQRIKNEIVGPGVEFVELYPKEDHKVDLSNQYHLWGFETEEPVFTGNGIGWREGRKVWNGIGPKPIPGTEKSVQRITDEESTV